MCCAVTLTASAKPIRVRSPSGIDEKEIQTTGGRVVTRVLGFSLTPWMYHYTNTSPPPQTAPRNPQYHRCAMGKDVNVTKCDLKRDQYLYLISGAKGWKIFI